MSQFATFLQYLFEAADHQNCVEVVDLFFELAVSRISVG
jgi:hypothetical protein